MRRLDDGIIAAALFFAAFALYLTSAAGHLPPYRDAGEMAVVGATLGVAHPPGYPLYALAANVATLLPFGTIPFRLSVLSALSGAGAVALLFLTLRRFFLVVGALAGAALAAVSNPFWELAVVPEMYALGALFLAAAAYAAFARENVPLTFFLVGMALGVRMDLLLLVPLFAAWFIWRGRTAEWGYGAVFFLAGVSVFLFLIFRSARDPVLDWANPETFSSLSASITRKSYGGTLDLLSLEYRPGENFFSSVAQYGSHWGVVSPFILATAGAGVAFFWRRHRAAASFFLSSFLMTGPVFFFLANMPPNPHAAAILEASFLTPDLMLAVFWAATFDSLGRQRRWRWAASAGAMTAVLLVGIEGGGRAWKRWNMFARDYVENVWRSAPRGAVAVLDDDVQLFSLWESQLVGRRRPDVALLAQGLSGAEWYWDTMRRWGTRVSPRVSLKEDGGWKRLANHAGDRVVLVAPDTFPPNEAEAPLRARGLLAQLVGPEKTPAFDGANMDRTLLFRGHYVYGETPDFFSTDLIGDYAQAYYRQGLKEMSAERPGVADGLFRRAEALDPAFAGPSINRGYMAFTMGAFDVAFRIFERAVRRAEATVAKAEAYNSLPDQRRAAKDRLAEAHTFAAAAAARVDRIDAARTHNRRAIAIRPTAQAYYNLALTYWNRDWAAVEKHLLETLRLDPAFPGAAGYLEQARARRRAS